jgi:NTP pyrophosphatase (non-canonical NTP hydrolase)
MSENEVYQKAIAKWGKELQLTLAMEECAELIQVLSKWRRSQAEDSEVRLEIADVILMMEQLKRMFGTEAQNDFCFGYKLARLQERLKG